MIAILAALFPVFAMIGVGYALRRRRLIADGFWAPAETLTFYLFFPALLVTSTARARFDGREVAALWAVLAIGMIAATLLALLLRTPLRLDRAALASVVQGAVRVNAYVGFAASSAVFGAEGLSLMAAAMVVVAPLINVIGVFAHFGLRPREGGRRGWTDVFRSILANPIIIAIAIGFALNVAGIGLPPLIGPLLDGLGSVALPLGLMAVGAALDFGAARRAGAALAAGSALKLLGLPLIVLGLCIGFGVEGTAATIAVLCAALPGSATSYVVSRQMGGDAALMAGIIAVTTIGAVLALPLWIVAMARF
jgi:predicted permease